MLQVIIAVLAFSAMAQANPIGFASGSTFTATPIQGQVQVTCDGFNGTGSAVFTCRDIVLDPQAYDFFMGPQEPSADRVELIATREDNTTRSKVTSYDGLRGRSREAFNLWISTLFQKPLLAYGKNLIQYRLYSVDVLVDTAANNQFVVNVIKGQKRVCPSARYTSTDVNDCNSQYSICQRYFEEFRNCQ